MLILDLPHCDKISAHQTVIGGVLLKVNALALAEGANTYTLTNTDVQLKVVGNGRLTLGKGKSEALAIGDFAFAYTDFQAIDVDKAIVKFKSREGDNFTYSKVRVKTITFH